MREQLRKTVEETTLYEARLRFSEPAVVRRMAAEAGVELSPQELEAEPLEMLQMLEQREIGIDVPVNNLIKLFLCGALDTSWVIFMLDWTVVRAPAGMEFVIGDVPVTCYDPTPIGRSGSASLLSSPNAQTFVPLDRSYGILMEPPAGFCEFFFANQTRFGTMTGEQRLEFAAEHEGGWADAAATEELAEHLRLRSYAHAQRYVFGSQAAVTCLHTEARRRRIEVGALRPRPPQIHIYEDDDSRPGGLRLVESLKAG